jgi:hypothetical protein
MKSLTTRSASRFICAAGSLLSLTLLAGTSFTPQAHARQSSQSVTLTSVSAPTYFASGQNIPVSIGLSSGTTQVQITSRPAGIVNYTATVVNGTTLSVPTTAVDTNGQPLSVTLVVKSGAQTIEVESETDGDLEPIFPSPSTTLLGDLEPIFPKPSTATIKGDLEPIFPKPVISTTAGDLEPIFPSPRTTPGDLEPIFPAPRTTPGDLEPIFPSPRVAALLARFRAITTGHTAHGL